jgi:excisionase family DNA binding protein
MNNTLTLEEAAMYLKLPSDTVAEQAAQGLLPGRRINQSWRFLRTAIDQWLRNSNGRQILLEQAGVFADDDSLAALRTQIYAERGRPEVDADATETCYTEIKKKT